MSRCTSYTQIKKPVPCVSGSDHQACVLHFRIRSTRRGTNVVVLCHHWGWSRLSVSPVEHRLAHGFHCHSAISAPGCHHLWRLRRCWLTHAGDAPSYTPNCCLPAVYIVVGVSLSICQCLPTAQQNWILASLKATECFPCASDQMNHGRKWLTVTLFFTRWYSLHRMPMLVVQQQQLPWQLLGAGHTWFAQQC